MAGNPLIVERTVILLVVQSQNILRDCIKVVGLFVGTYVNIIVCLGELANQIDFRVVLIVSFII